MTGLLGEENTQVFNLIIQKIKMVANPSICRIDPKTKPSLKQILQNIKYKTQVSQELFEMPNTTTNTNNTMKNPDLKPIVVIIENIELLDVQTVQNLLKVLCFRRKQRTSFFLILGSSCEFYSWCNIVPLEVSSNFIQREFNVPSTKKLSNAFYDIILDFKIPIKLSGQIVKYFKSYFETIEFSLTRLMQVYQLCLMKKFQHLKDDHVPYLILEFDPIPKEENNDNNNLSGDNNVVDVVMMKNIAIYHDKMLDWYKVINFMFGINNSTENHCGLLHTPHFSDAYILPWENNFFYKERNLQQDEDDEDSGLEKLQNTLNGKNLTMIKSILQNGQKSVDNIQKIQIHEVNIRKSKIDNLFDELQKLLDSSNNDNNNQENQRPKRLIKPPKNGMSMSEYREHFKNLFQGDDFKMVKNTKEWLKKLCNTGLKFYYNLDHKLREIFVFDDLQPIQIYLSSSIGKNLHNDLTSDTLLQTEEEEPINEKPDTCKLYGLVLEQQVLNVHMDDLYQSFKEIIRIVDEEEEEKNSKRSKRARIDNNLQHQVEYLCRFKQAILELQLLGILKSSNRKPDELSKQFWPF